MSAERRSDFRRLVLRSVSVWLVVIAAEIIHGIVRAIMLAPLVGQFRSDQIGVLTGSMIILLIAYLSAGWLAAESLGKQLLVGAIWVAFTVAFELTFGIFVLGLPWREIAASYDVTRGGLMPLGLLLMFLAPTIAARWHGKRRHTGK